MHNLAGCDPFIRVCQPIVNMNYELKNAQPDYALCIMH